MLQDQSVSVGLLDLLEVQVGEVTVEELEKLEQKGLQGHLAKPAKMANKVLLESPEHVGQMVLLDQQALLEALAVMVPQAAKVCLEQQEQRVRMALLENLALMARPGGQVKVLLVRQAALDCLAMEGPQAMVDH